MAKSPALNGLENWSALVTSLLWAHEFSLPPDRPSPSWQSYPSLALLVRRGAVRFRFDTEENYPAGSWVFPKDSSGFYSLEPGSDVLAIRFFAKWPNTTSLFERAKTIVFSQHEAPLLTKAATKLTRYISRNSLLESPGYGKAPRLNGTLENYIQIQSLFATWIVAYFTTFTAHGYEPVRFSSLSEKMRMCLRYLRDRPFSQPFQESELAKFAGVSLSQICKIFVQEIGKTPQAYWNSQRLSAAQLELTDTDKSIKEIAFALGFSSQGHFSHWFQKQMGCSPRAYRNPNILPKFSHGA